MSVEWVPQYNPQLLRDPHPHEQHRRLDQLRDLWPEAFVEGELSLDLLAQMLGLRPHDQRALYGLQWAGKPQAQDALRYRSPATLVPTPDINQPHFDRAPHLLVQGDNLEVLRVMQKSLHGRVKLIYIDPPYNFGGDFVYQDDYRHGLDEYLRFTGQMAGGQRTSSNSEADGRYHSRWLSMMYPRLALARTLLRDDGVLFVSIDDHEQPQLRLILDELFGPDNFVAQIVWERKEGAKNDAKYFSVNHEYLLVYARDMSQWSRNLLPRTERSNKRFKNLDDDPRGPWAMTSVTARSGSATTWYEVVGPKGQHLWPTPGSYWCCSAETFKQWDADNRIWWGRGGHGRPVRKVFISEVQQGLVPTTWWNHSDAGHTNMARRELRKRISFPDGSDTFQTPKPTALIRRILQIATSPDGGDLVLDFFAGTGTTGEVVMAANAEDGGDRRCVLIQLPEPCPDTGYATIVDICRARLDSARQQLLEDNSGLDPTSLQWRELALAPSVWAQWEADDPQQAMDNMATTGAAKADFDSVVTQVLLRSGMDPGVCWERTEVAGTPAVAVQDPGGRRILIISAHQAPGHITIASILDRRPLPTEVVLMEDMFVGADADKANCVAALNRRGIVVRTV